MRFNVQNYGSSNKASCKSQVEHSYNPETPLQIVTGLDNVVGLRRPIVEGHLQDRPHRFKAETISGSYYRNLGLEGPVPDWWPPRPNYNLQCTLRAEPLRSRPKPKP